MEKSKNVQFLCKDCARYNLCEYYHNRKEDSYICNYFHLPESESKGKMSKEQLTKIREYIIDNVMMNETFMYSDEVRGENEGDPDLLEVIASLYEVLHREVTGEPYNYMFHYANKIYGCVEDGLFTEVENEKNNNTSSIK